MVTNGRLIREEAGLSSSTSPSTILTSLAIAWINSSREKQTNGTPQGRTGLARFIDHRIPARRRTPDRQTKFGPGIGKWL